MKICENDFARAGARSLDVQVKSLTLYQLSYPGYLKTIKNYKKYKFKLDLKKLINSSVNLLFLKHFFYDGASLMSNNKVQSVLSFLR